VTVFPRVLETAYDLLNVDRLVGLKLTAGNRNGELNLVADEVFPLDELETRMRLSVTLTLKEPEVDSERLEAVSTLMKEHPGEAPVLFRVKDEGESVEVMAGRSFCVHPSSELKEGLEALLGEGRVRFLNGVRQ